ncbi:hypothetical protein GGTG_04685 [Gaeumannomyces tritici R3-111a-1]|uniref:Uncharacterized protein n=1 Tax=Gaeumannomyces tritici (strain R3-111a-1) TaxID=644352 RepID=J3NTT6_GAET3|nr:hypothetical protein GGTG_04685 [Gaeumannomyces tritici R3-111a-1]EJT79601.1 hypothetical protein GGTG_04685 [Gaeumannomyces tritici R3-111a-1]
MQGNSESVFRSNYQPHHVAEKLIAVGFGRFVKHDDDGGDEWLYELLRDALLMRDDGRGQAAKEYFEAAGQAETPRRVDRQPLRRRHGSAPQVGPRQLLGRATPSASTFAA